MRLYGIDPGRKHSGKYTWSDPGSKHGRDIGTIEKLPRRGSLP